MAARTRDVTKNRMILFLSIVFGLLYILGWLVQGYMLPLLCKKISVKAAVIINGVLWGFAHAPLIYYGMNFGTDYCGAPYTGIAMMILVTIVLGI